MGKPLPPAANPASATPPSGDQANAVITGAFSAQGQASAPFCFYGALNVLMWASVTQDLKTFAGSASIGVASTTGLVGGVSVSSPLLPPGALLTTGQISGTTSSQIGGLTTAQIAGIVTGDDPAAIFAGGLAGNATGTIALQRSFDGGNTWITAGIGGGGTPATYQFGGSGGLTDSVSFVAAEPEKGVAYRLVALTAITGTINYRLSATGLAAMTWGIPVG